MRNRHRLATGAGEAATRPARGSRRRADAQRNISAILEAALASLGRDPEVNMADIARAAGVGRVTLYGHFPSKEALVEAAVAHAIARANEVLDGIDLGKRPAVRELAALAHAAWQVLSRHRQLLAAGHRHLGPARMHAHHDQVMGRVEELIARGQRAGELRTDLPRAWLAATFHALLHAAGDEVNAGRLESDEAGAVVAATVVTALSPPPS